MTPRMREEPIRSLLLLDSNPEERRLISAIAGRAGWSVVGAADEEMALALLQGPLVSATRTRALVHAGVQTDYLGSSLQR